LLQVALVTLVATRSLLFWIDARFLSFWTIYPPALARRCLSAVQFQALWLRYAEDLELAEIARVLGKTRIHVKVLLFRARKTLGNALANGSMYGASGRYLKRLVDFRSVLGEIIRKHLGAAFDTANPYSSSQLSRIIPGYGSSADSLYSVGPASDGTKVRGEVGFLLP